MNFSTPSDLRFKNEIKEDVPGIDFINRLRPVSYLMNTSAYDEFVGVSSESKTLLDQMRPKPTRQIGFIAQEVEKIVKDGYVFSGLIVPENDKDHYSLRYAEFVVPLVKAVQELNAKVQSQQQQIENLINGLGKNVDSAATAPTPRIKLNQNVPNPFSSETEIRMSIPESTRSASLMVFSLDGKELKSIEVRSRGDNVKITISAGELSAGMYLYSLITDGQIADTKRLILTK